MKFSLYRLESFFAGSTDYGSNTSGAIIFFSYIVAALLLTGAIGKIQWHEYHSSRIHHLITSKLKQKLLFCLALVLISFSVLSYHMLMFLVDSYVQWSQDHNTALPSTPSLLSIYESWHTFHIWQWARNTPLFTRFAHEVFRVQEARDFTFLALAWELVVTVSVSRTARDLGMKHVWLYISLAQILPISFVQNLFEMARVMKTAEATHAVRQTSKQPSKKRSSKTASANHIPLERMIRFSLTMCLYAIYAIVISHLQQQQGEGLQMMLQVLVTRCLLCLTAIFVLSKGYQDGESLLEESTVAVLFTLWFCSPRSIGYFMPLWSSSKAWNNLSRTNLSFGFDGLGSNHAVAALGWDALIGITSASLHMVY